MSPAPSVTSKGSRGAGAGIFKAAVSANAQSLPWHQTCCSNAMGPSFRIEPGCALAGALLAVCTPSLIAMALSDCHDQQMLPWSCTRDARVLSPDPEHPCDEPFEARASRPGVHNGRMHARGPGGRRRAGVPGPSPGVLGAEQGGHAGPAVPRRTRRTLHLALRAGGGCGAVVSHALGRRHPPLAGGPAVPVGILSRGWGLGTWAAQVRRGLGGGACQALRQVPDWVPIARVWMRPASAPHTSAL